MGTQFEFKYGKEPIRIKSNETFRVEIKFDLPRNIHIEGDLVVMEVQRMDGRMDKLMMPRSLFQKILEICDTAGLK